MQKELIKGNEAVIKGAILAGCSQYFGYPITPASEIAQAAAKYLPPVGGTFIQAESEVAAINMVYGAAAAGMRVMTASSGPGISLKQEGISYIAAAELPCVIVDIMRAGPGLGNIWPEQGDYHQVVWGGGHGNYKCLVLAPNCAQEMCDLTMLAFDLADKYRNPAWVLADGYVGQMMEPVVFPHKRTAVPRNDWALYGDAASQAQPGQLDLHERGRPRRAEPQAAGQVRGDGSRRSALRGNRRRRRRARARRLRHRLAPAAFGRAATARRRQEGRPAPPDHALPVPDKRLAELAAQGKQFLVVELSNGQMVKDVQLATRQITPVHFYNRMGGAVPSVEELANVTRGYLK